MSFAHILAAHFTMAQTLELCLRLLLAGIFGAAIGFERSKRFKEAGIRTHIIVCCGAALFMIVSKYALWISAWLTAARSPARAARIPPAWRPRWSAVSAFSAPV